MSQASANKGYKTVKTCTRVEKSESAATINLQPIMTNYSGHIMATVPRFEGPVGLTN